MKKNGFTLIELLGVIIILALLILLVFPSIINSIKKTSNKIDKETLNLIYNASDIYISQNNDNFPKTNGNKYIINISDLVIEDLLPDDLTLSNKEILNDKCVQATYNDGYTYVIKSGNICLNNVIVVDLVEGLTPIIYNGTNWEVADTSEEWYNYSNQEWANAAILSDGISKEPGTQLTDLNNQVKAMFVYIPRYEYKIEGAYGKGGISAELPGEIEVNFISMSQKKSTPGYEIHPAFKFGIKKLYGIWVGKFELSHITAESQDLVDESLQNNKDCSETDDLGNAICQWRLNSLSCTDENCNESDGVRILPNVSSLRYNDVSTFFYTIRSISRDGNGFGIEGNTHMIKNSEWGSVAFLSQSKYGKYGNTNYTGANKEIYQNKSKNFITGMSNRTPSQFEFAEEQCSYDDSTNNCGIGASTTGNITGIYDMSGGSLEFIMTKNNKSEYYECLEDTPKSQCVEDRSGFNTLPETKYYEYYLQDYNDNETCTNKKNYYPGHAIWDFSINCSSPEMLSFTTWYRDSVGYSGLYNGPWFSRGGTFDYENGAGIFSAGEVYEQGGATAYYSTRVVLVSD